jgi:hypothetical protein
MKELKPLGREDSSFYSLKVLRDGIPWAPTQEEIVELTTQIVNTKSVVEEMSNQPQRMLLDCYDVQQSLTQEEPTISPSPASIAAEFVLRSAWNKTIQAQFHYAQESTTNKDLLPAFAFFYDFGNGIADPLQTLRRAEQINAGVSVTDLFQERMNTLIELHSTLNLNTIPLGDQAEVFLKYTAKMKRAAESLKLDPSGFEYMKTYMENIRKDVGIEIFSLHIPEIVVAGAEHATELYKTIYPSAVQITEEHIGKQS